MGSLLLPHIAHLLSQGSWQAWWGADAIWEVQVHLIFITTAWHIVVVWGSKVLLNTVRSLCMEAGIMPVGYRCLLEYWSCIAKQMGEGTFKTIVSNMCYPGRREIMPTFCFPREQYPKEWLFHLTRSLFSARRILYKTSVP